MASLFELQNPPFGQLTKTKGVKLENDGAVTLTTAEIIEGIVEGTPTENVALTTPTGAAIVAALGQQALLHQCFEITIINTATSGTKNFTLTAAATGINIVGSAVVAPATSGTFIGRVENPASGQEVVTFYRK